MKIKRILLSVLFIISMEFFAIWFFIYFSMLFNNLDNNYWITDNIQYFGIISLILFISFMVISIKKEINIFE